MQNSRVDYNRISYFLKIVQAGNITRAGEILNEPKAKISRQLALLEDELGLQLVYRTTRQFRLTETGSIFYERCKAHVEGLNVAINQIKEDTESLKGEIKITATEDIGAYVVNDIVSEFSRIHPEIKFNLIYTNQVLDIVKLGIDVAFRMGKLKDSSIVHKKAGHIEFVLVASPDFIKKIKNINSVDQLTQVECICFNASEKIRPWVLTSGNLKKNLNIRGKFTANNYETIMQLACAGKGVAFIPKMMCVEQLKDGKLIHILKSWGNEKEPIQVLVPNQRNISKKIRTFFDFAVAKINNRP